MDIRAKYFGHIAFFLALSIGGVASFLFDAASPNPRYRIQDYPHGLIGVNLTKNGCDETIAYGQGSGMSGASNRNDELVEPVESRPLLLTKLPQPKYTEEARKDGVEGQVELKIVFLASGQIGSVRSVRELSGGLTDNAIKAARCIQFKPRIENWRRKSVVRSVEFKFTLE